MMRFTDTTKWSNPFFRSLSPTLRLAWLYILDDCDKAGFWVPEFDVLSVRLGVQVTGDQALVAFGDHVFQHTDGSWQIRDFFSLQYPRATPAKCSNMVKSAFDLLDAYSKKFSSEVFFLAGVTSGPLADGMPSQTPAARRDGIPSRGMPLRDGAGDVAGGGDVDGSTSSKLENRFTKTGGGAGGDFDSGALAEASMKLSAERLRFAWPRLDEPLRKALYEAQAAHGVGCLDAGWCLYLQGFKGPKTLRNYLQHVETWINQLPHPEPKRCVHNEECRTEFTTVLSTGSAVEEAIYFCSKCGHVFRREKISESAGAA